MHVSHGPYVQQTHRPLDYYTCHDHCCMISHNTCHSGYYCCSVRFVALSVCQSHHDCSSYSCRTTGVSTIAPLPASLSERKAVKQTRRDSPTRRSHWHPCLFSLSAAAVPLYCCKFIFVRVSVTLRRRFHAGHRGQTICSSCLERGLTLCFTGKFTTVSTTILDVAYLLHFEY